MLREEKEACCASGLSVIDEIITYCEYHAELYTCFCVLDMIYGESCGGIKRVRGCKRWNDGVTVDTEGNI